MARAIWNGAVIAEGDDVTVVEGNAYFPRAAVHAEYLVDSDHRTRCPWKGYASYYHLSVNGELNRNAAWYYADPSEAATHLKDRVAFWRGVGIEL